MPVPNEQNAVPLGGVDPTIAAALGALGGTLSGDGGLTALQAQMQQLLGQNAQAAQEASKAAAGAGQQYQQAAAAPPPQLGPLAGFIPSLMGNTASVLSGNPAYQQQGAAEVRQRQADLLTQRAQTLAALKDTYDKKAELAQAAGDLNDREKYLALSDKINKAQQDIHDQQQHEFAMQQLGKTGENQIALEKERGRQDRLTVDQKASGTDQLDPTLVDANTITSYHGNKFVNLSQITDAKQKVMAQKIAAQRGLPTVDAQGMADLREIQRSEAGVDELMNQIGDKLPADWQQRVAQTPGITFDKMMQSNAQRAAFASWRTLAINTLRATAGSKGLRINQAEIAAATANDIPQINDTMETAQQKMANIRMMLKNGEDAYLRNDWSQTPRARALKAARTGDDASLAQSIKENPVLNDDPEILSLVRSQKARRPKPPMTPAGAR